MIPRRALSKLNLPISETQPGVLTTSRPRNVAGFTEKNNNTKEPAKMNALDNEITPYVDETQHALDNRLMLNWYAGRILKMAEMDSMLELGLGHGITASRFAGKFRRYVVLEGSDKVIQRFKDVYSTEAQKIEIIKTFFETFQPIETFQNILRSEEHTS